MKDHSLDVLSNVVSSRLLDESETVAESIESDEVSNEADSKENSFGSKLPKIESGPSKNLGESKSEMQKSRDSSEDSYKSNYVSDSSEDNRSVKLTAILPKIVMTKRSSHMTIGKSKLLGSVKMKRILFPKKVNLVSQRKRIRSLI